MNPGLRYLLAMGPTSLMRRLKRRLRGARGVATLVGVIFLIVLLAGPQIARVAMRDVEQLATTVANVRLFGPPAILLLILLTSASGGFLFKPAEIQFLFPAPVGRKELLIYNALGKLRLQLLSGLWIATFTLAYAPLWYGAVLATCLILAFWQLSAQTIGLMLATIEQRFGARARKLVMLAVAGFLLVGIATTIARVPEGAGLSAALKTVASWAPLAWLSLPLRPLIEVYVAATPAALALWAAVSAALIAVLFPLMTLFDVAFTESAIARSQKVQRAIERMRSGASPFAARGNVRRGRLHVPGLPHWRGAGPIAWRQLQEMTRNYRSVLMMGAMMFLFIGMFQLMPRIMGADGPARNGMPAPVLIAIIAFMLPMMAIHAAFDFRRDLSRMAVLKALPLSGFSLALGQIIPTTVLLTFWEVVAVIVIGLTAATSDWPLFAAILTVLVPLNATLVCIDNILFLLMPYRIVARDPGQMPFMPRLMLVMFLKMLLLILLGAIAVIPGALIFAVTQSVMLAGIAVAAFLTPVCAGAVWGVAAAFRAFDVSRDIPD